MPLKVTSDKMLLTCLQSSALDTAPSPHDMLFANGNLLRDRDHVLPPPTPWPVGTEPTAGRRRDRPVATWSDSVVTGTVTPSAESRAVSHGFAPSPKNPQIMLEPES